MPETIKQFCACAGWLINYGDQTWEEMHFPSYGLVLSDPTIDPRRVIRTAPLGNRGN